LDFKRKRDPSGNITKHKARCCVIGDQQIAGVDCFESYAPVVAWTSVQLNFIMLLIAKLEVVQVDYTNAFVQATLTEEVYIKVPMGFHTGVVLKLRQSL
jgi:Reverse transcriptase (RNA-dependent DNA polymerase)